MKSMKHKVVSHGSFWVTRMLINTYGTEIEGSERKLFPSAEQIKGASIEEPLSLLLK